jgi:hypothetical protein
MKNDVQLYRNPLNGECRLQITEMNSGSKVLKTRVSLEQLQSALQPSFQY